ncbi:MAG: DUF4440 domain-containing protein [Methanomassiliicoccus sp.]|nr:DUF4440 domain-containing protein [Methanomassiliicoccus sp.]
MKGTETRSVAHVDEINDLNRCFSRGIELGDASLAASVYADDAILFPDGEKIEGLAAIEAFWYEAIRSGAKRVDLQMVELIGGDEYLLENGTVVLTVMHGGRAIERTSKYVAVWKRTANGWKKQRDIWTSTS